MRGVLRWLEDRTGLWSWLVKMATHRVPGGLAGPHGWWYVFGYATLAALIVQAVTGMTLATKYIPSPAHAYDSLQFITDDAAFGRIVRGMHYYGAGAMVLLVFVHMVRTFLTGSYKFPREVQWLSGAALLAVTLALAFTGQLLRWDENGVWSVAVAANFVGRVPLIGDFLVDFLLAGDTVGGTTLSRFFAFHVFLLPALLVAVLSLHLYLVLRNGISEPVDREEPVDPELYYERRAEALERAGIPYFPDVLSRELMTGLVVVVVIVALAVLFGPRPLGGPPDPTIVQADPRPDWYFRWYYALIAIVPGTATEFLLVWLPLLAFAILFILPFVAPHGHRHPFHRPWAVGTVAVLFVTWAALTLQGQRPFWVPDFETAPVAQAVALETGPARQGAELFHAKGCQHCHMVAGLGGRYGPDLTHVMRGFEPEQLAVIILRGRDNMPAYRNSLTDEELAAILAFLAALSER
jgi:ubiquinol-cytochrome c reductase cytochrome b subunit